MHVLGLRSESKELKRSLTSQTLAYERFTSSMLLLPLCGAAGAAREDAEANFEQVLALKFSTEVTLLQPELLSDCMSFMLTACQW